MNLLREYIRELLTESVDSKMMELIDRLEKNGWKIKLMKDRAILFNPAGLGKPDVKVNQGTIGWATPDEVEQENYGWCHSANMVQSSYAAGGFGPILYDVAIEASGDAGLIPDRHSVSTAATGVWNYYMRNRSDVQVKQLDNKENKLTPRDYDNCDQRVSLKDVGAGLGGTNSFLDDTEEDNYEKWPESSLSKVYYKYGTPVIDELERRGLLVRVK